MNVKIINYGGQPPERAHYNDAGADVFANITLENCENSGNLELLRQVSNKPSTTAKTTNIRTSQSAVPAMVIPPYTIKKIPLGFGINLPDGFVAYVLPRSGMAANKGITAEVVPIDSGYTGEIHAILHNTTKEPYWVCSGDKVAQLVVSPITLVNFVTEHNVTRGTKGFGSTGF